MKSFQRLFLTLFTVVTMPVVGIGTACGIADEFKYRSDRFGAEFENSTTRTFRFLNARPDDLKVDLKFQGNEQLFGQFRHGSDDSTRVAIVLDLFESDRKTEFELFADLNRDRRLEESERIDGEGRVRIFDIDAEINRGGTPEYHQRTIRFRKSLEPTNYTIRTLGGSQGQCRLQDRSIKVRRIDGDGNGLFSDTRDQIWIDLNGDDQWNALTERFPFQTAMRIEDARYSVRADQLGMKFLLVPLEGEGTAQVDLRLVDKDATVESLSMTLFGEDGATFRITSTDPASLPVGRYMVGALSLLLLDGESIEPWYFSFSHSGRDGEGEWYKIEKDVETQIDPIGGFDFQLRGDRSYKADSSINVRPVLLTENKLYLIASGREKPNRFSQISGNPASVSGLDSSQTVFDTTESGFR